MKARSVTATWPEARRQPILLFHSLPDAAANRGLASGNHDVVAVLMPAVGRFEADGSPVAGSQRLHCSKKRPKYTT
ncbi:hypothetical protein HOE425_320113 [Hoeflea sp. EC-HK425]|nr:hypothetical protein HOE425_320113 [Hoeflea sp. EC-HK425]